MSRPFWRQRPTDLEPSPTSSGRVEIAARLALVSLFLGLYWWTSGRTFDLITDFGREVYAAWRLAEGDHLYRDLAWINGPLAVELNALLFGLFGTSIRILQRSSALLLAVASASLFRWLRTRTDLMTAATCGVIFVTLFGFGLASPKGNYNWLTPYSYDATYGLVLGSAAVALLLIWRPGRSAMWPVASGIAVGLCAMTKPDLLVAAACACVVRLMLERSAKGPERRGVAKALALWLGSAVLPALVAWMGLSSTLHFRDALFGLLGGWKWVLNGTVTDLVFYRRMSGISEFGPNLSEAARVLGCWALLLVPASLLALRSARYTDRVAQLTWSLVPALAAVLLSAFGWQSWLAAARALPFALLIVMAIAGWRAARNRLSGSAARETLVWAVFSLALLPKIALKADLGFYGFVLAAPGTLLIAVMLLHSMPSWIALHGGNGLLFRQFAVAALAALVLAYVAVFLPVQRLRTTPVSIGGDRFVNDLRAEDFARVTEDLRTRAAGDATLAVLPEGALLNYLTRLKNPTPYVTFLPPELAFFGEEAMLRSLAQAPPTFIVLVDRSTAEYGVPRFGFDYGGKIWRWAAQRYVLVSKYGTPSVRSAYPFRMALLRLRSEPDDAADKAAPRPVVLRPRDAADPGGP